MKLAAAAAVVLTGYTVGSRFLPALSGAFEVLVPTLVVLSLAAALMYGLLPARSLGSRLLLIALLSLIAAVVFSRLDWVPVANLAKITLATSFGFWIIAQIEDLLVIVLVAAVSAAVDIFSVFAGPTKAIIESHPGALDYFGVMIAAFGYSYDVAAALLGTSDFFFFAVYMAAAEAFGLRTVRTVVFMVLSVVATMAFSIWARALPELPLLALGFLAANGDLLWARRREMVSEMRWR